MPAAVCITYRLLQRKGDVCVCVSARVRCRAVATVRRAPILGMCDKETSGLA